jgi:SAM-dependent methyltransferase
VRRRLVDLLACPRCQGTFRAEAFEEAKVPGMRPAAVPCRVVCAWRNTEADASIGPDDCARCYASDIVEGKLTCLQCGTVFPIIGGVPRLITATLLGQIARRYSEFFTRHPELLPATPPVVDPLADTLESFTRQRLDLRPPGPEFARQWRENLARNLGPALPVEQLRDRLVLDVGSGFGRHLFVACAAGAEAVGVDLSGGVDVARANNVGHPRCHVLQANVMERPLRAGTFDVVWSFGVLHHMPEPRAGFAAIVPLARADGGLVVIWVYGYRGMALTYRLSHMRPLHRLSRTLSGTARVRASKAVAGVLSGLYWLPLRAAKRAGLGRVVERLPLASYVDHDWKARIAAVHDRLSTPITHFHDRDELDAWFRGADLEQVSVEDTARRGWRAHGMRRNGEAMARAD